jgi:chloramphenicol O-acetyltransferase type B
MTSTKGTTTFMQRIKRWLGLGNDIPGLQNYERQQEKFRKKYPGYEIGVASYGLPTVHDTHQGTTLRIGAYCSIASGVQIFLGNQHRTDWVSTFPFPAFFEEARTIADFETSRGDVTIGSDVWLCADCSILSGVKIGHGAVVAMGAVVTRDVEPYSVVAGNPARHVRWRFDEPTRLALLNAAWWSWPLAEVRSVAKLLCSDKVQNLLDYSLNRGPDPDPNNARNKDQN